MIITINKLKWEVVVKTHNDMPNKPKDPDHVALGRTYETTLRIYLNKDVDKQVLRTPKNLYKQKKAMLGK